MSKLTYKIVANSIIDDFNFDIIVDWAIELLEEGVETENIQIIAGLKKPVNYFESKKYLEDTLKELGLDKFTEKQKIICYSSFYIQMIAAGKDVRHNLSMIYKFCQKMDYEDTTYDFYLLYWAWGDLEYQDYNHYWESAKRNNIESIVISTAKEWVDKNSMNFTAEEKYFR